jgi:hypothetical protein
LNRKTDVTNLQFFITAVVLVVVATTFLFFIVRSSRATRRVRSDNEEMAQKHWPDSTSTGESFSALVERHSGDLLEALETKGMMLECDADGAVVRISDPMRCGDFTDEEFVRLAALPKLHTIGLRGT